jgi:hypothetical protein
MARGYGREIERWLRAAGCTFVRDGKSDHEIWHRPITNRHFVFDRGVRVRHTANGILQAGLPKTF